MSQTEEATRRWHREQASSLLNVNSSPLHNFYTLHRAHCIPRSAAAAVLQRLSLCLCARSAVCHSPVFCTSRHESNRV